MSHRERTARRQRASGAFNPAHRFRSVAHDWFGAVKTHGRRTVTSAIPGGDRAVLTLGNTDLEQATALITIKM